MMRVLVTGGAGFIGGRLVQSADAEFRFTPVGRNVGGTKTVINWTDTASIAALCKQHDAIVHLAAMNEQDSAKDPASAQRVNVDYTRNLLASAEAVGVKRFVYLSTSKVFGGNLHGDIDESSAPSPINQYAITHHLAERLVLSETGKSNLQRGVLRLSNAVGEPADPRANVWMLIANDLCRQAATDGRIKLASSGLAWRNFIAMTDVVAAIRHILKLPVPILADGMFHLGGIASLRIYDLASLVARRAEVLLGHAVSIDRAAPLDGEQFPTLNWRIEKLMATGWAPVAQIEKEIDRTLLMCQKKFAASA